MAVGERERGGKGIVLSRMLGKGQPSWLRYVQAAGLVLAATLVGELVRRLFSPVNLVMLYLLGVVAAAVYLGRGPSILAAILSVVAFDLFFVQPRLTLAVSDPLEIFTFAALLIVGLVITSLTARVRE
jgi:two-component system, OmpR family, sensor histidine kinase KdpD